MTATHHYHYRLQFHKEILTQYQLVKAKHHSEKLSQFTKEDRIPGVFKINLKPISNIIPEF